MKNFANGSLVFRIWRFDGSGEVIGKFQYFGDAQAFARLKAADDASTRPGTAKDYFYLATCEAEGEVKSFNPIPPDPKAAQ